MANEIRVRIKTDAIKHYYNTGTTALPVYVRIGAGIVSWTKNLNPNTEDVQDIDMKNSMTLLNNFNPQVPYEAQRTPEDNNPFADQLFKIAREEIQDATVEILDIYTDKEDTTPGTFFAVKRTFSVIPDSTGGDAGSADATSGNLQAITDLVQGSAVIATGDIPTFTAA